MKKNYFSLLFICSSALCFSQTTINSTDLNATIGESFDYAQTPYQNPGSSGADVTWDFSSSTIDNNSTVNFNAANTSFPNTNITYSDVDGAQIFYDFASNGKHIHGMDDNAGTVLTYSNPMTQYEYPLSMGSSGSDTFYATFTASGYDFVREGTTTWEVDGYGTLITPNNTYTDVLRVHHTQIYTDTYSGGTINYNSDIHYWFKAGIHFELASQSYTTTDLGDFSSGAYVTSNVGIEEMGRDKVQLYPNPTKDIFTISSNKEIDKVIVYSLDGKVQLEKETSEIDMTKLNNGYYFVNVIFTDGTSESNIKVVKI